MGDWMEISLGDIIDVKHGFAFKGEFFQTEPNNIILTTPRNFKIGGGWKEDKCKYYNGDILEDYILKGGELVVTMTDLSKEVDTLGYSAIIPKKEEKTYLHNQRIGLVDVIKDEIDKDYLYWLMRDKEYRWHIVSSASGSTVSHTSPTRIKEYKFLLPPLPEQKAIAAVLSSLDDKIDLLHLQNKTLEAMAETLFRQRFVEEAQEDWEEIVITDLFEIRDGTHDSPKQSPVGKPLITSKHISTYWLDIKNAYLISEDDFHIVNKRSKVETNDILFSMIGTIGLSYLEQSETVDYAIKNIGLFKTSQNPEWRYYTFLWINSFLGKEFIHEYRSGSTQEYIALGSLRSIVFDVPPLSLLLEFNKVIHTYFQKIKNNMLQIRTLGKLRDILLPKLVSGEVRVKMEAYS